MLNEYFLKNTDVNERWKTVDGSRYLSALYKFFRGESEFPESLREIVYDNKGVKRLDCKGIYLCDVSATGLELANFDFKLSCFEKCKFEKVNFFGSIFDESNFRNISFKECILTSISCVNTIFNNTKINKCYIDSANLNHTTFSKSNLTDVDFSFSTLSFVKMIETKIIDADVHNAKGVNF